MVLTALVLLAQTSPVTLQTEALPLRKLIPELAKVTGLPLAVSPEVQWQVVYLRVKDVPASELLNRIAKVSFGTWEATSDGKQTLKRDAGALSRLEDEKRKSRLEGLQEAFKGIFDPKAKVSDTTRSLARVAQRVGLGTLANLGPSQRLVFSTVPTQMQRPMPPIDANTFSDLILSHNKGVDKQAARGDENTDEEMKKFEAQMPPEYLKMIKDMEESMKPKRIDGAPAKIDLIFANQYGVTAILKMFDAKGDELASFQTSFADGESDEMMVPGAFGTAAVAAAEVSRGIRQGQEEGEKKPEPDKTPVIKLSKESAEIFGLTYFEESELGMNRGKKPEELKKRVAAIAEKDPFLDADTELLNGYAANVPDNIVFNVSDSFMDYREGKQITVGLVESELSPEKKDGWSVSIPDDYEPRVDRDLLTLAVAKVKNGAELSIDDKAWLAANEERLGGSSNALMEKIYQVFGVNSYTWRNKPLLKLYGSMNQSQKTLAAGNGLPVSSLSTDQRRLIERTCYGAELYVKPYGAMSDFDEEALFSMDFEEAMRRQMASVTLGQDYLNEPTESMPQGVPSGAMITLGRKSEEAFLPIQQGDQEGMMDFMGEMGGVTLDMLAAMMSMGEMMGQPEVAAMMPTSVKHAVRDTLKLKLNCTDKVGYEENHRSAKADPGGKSTKIADLPGFGEKLAKRKEMMKKWKPMFEMGMGFGARRGSPPPL